MIKITIFTIFLSQIPFSQNQKSCNFIENQILDTKCRENLEKLYGELRKNANISDGHFPPYENARKSAEFCEKSMTCLNSINCSRSISVKVHILPVCQGIRQFSGEFGKCISELQKNPNLKKLANFSSCSKFLPTDKNPESSLKCEIFTRGQNSKCFENLLREMCGDSAFRNFQQISEQLKDSLGC
ncbi:unnamed protein product [Caenorhabditis angaria]|uniref:T20D4.11-like domain-containing protein n=1 Tax=Caenorhabditis angaria TaxID=860376 RepID=A0A9P1I765_9PELO|nr:unnamed protein product [Caenorhabditis angaria]